jgi:hypothetical protein
MRQLKCNVLICIHHSEGCLEKPVKQTCLQYKLWRVCSYRRAYDNYLLDKKLVQQAIKNEIERLK